MLLPVLSDEAFDVEAPAEAALAEVFDGPAAVALGGVEVVLGLSLAILGVAVVEALVLGGVTAVAGLVSAWEALAPDMFFSEAPCSEELAAVEAVLEDPLPRRRERLFFAPLEDVGVELCEVGVVPGSAASVVGAALSVVVGRPWEASADVGCTSS